MRTLDDLRRSFEQHADLAGDPRGLVQAAREGAVRIRRRQRMIRTAVSAAVIAVLVVAVPVVANRTLAEKQVPASPADRQFGQVTADLDVPDYAVRSVTSLATRQDLIVGSSRNWDPGVDVVVFDPGVFTARAQPGMESITIAGRDGWFQPSLPLGGVSGHPTDDALGPAVGWADRSGVQVVVYRRPDLAVQNGLDAQRAELLRVAEGLRIGEPRDVTVPFRLGWVPAGLEVAGITAITDFAGAGGSVTLRRGDVEVDVAAGARGSQPTNFDGLPQTALTVAGRPAVLVDFKERHRLVVPELGTCALAAETADKQTTTADLVRVLETMTVADCNDRSTWTRPQR